MKLRWRHVLLTLAILALLSGLYLWFFGLQTMMVLETRWMAGHTPVMRLTPRALPDISVATAGGTKFSYFGYVFELPWNDLDNPKTKAGANNVLLTFRSGRRVKFTSLGPREFVSRFLRYTNEESFRRLYGEQPLRSDYAMWKFVADATPEKVTVFGSRQQAISVPIILVIKAIIAPEKSAIYSLRTKDFKGFQWGDPKKHPRSIVLDLFADDGGMEFVFMPPAGEETLTISQAEINRVLRTVHKNTSITVQTDSPKRTVSSTR